MIIFPGDLVRAAESGWFTTLFPVLIVDSLGPHRFAWAKSSAKPEEIGIATAVLESGQCYFVFPTGVGWNHRGRVERVVP